MAEQTYNRESAIEATRASAHLPGLDVDIVHQQSPNRDWEQLTISLRGTPSFDAFGRAFEPADPFALWLKAAQVMWMPWLLTAQAMLLPGAQPRVP
jgi:hypothetical protein